MQTIKRNMALCLALEALWMTYFGLSVTVVYYNAHGLSQAEVNIIQATFSLAMVLGNVPGGYLADRFGLRRMVVIGTAWQAVQSVLFLLCSSFWQFGLALAMNGFGWAILTKTTQTIITATLAASDKSKDGHKEAYSTFEGRLTLAQNSGLLGGMLLGGLMVAEGSLNLPFVLQPIVYVVAVVVGLFLRDAQPAMSFKAPALDAIIGAVKLMLVERRDIRRFIILVAILHTALLSCTWLLQPKMQAVGIPMGLFSVFYVSRICLTMVLGRLMKLLRKKMGDFYVFGLLICVMSLSTLAAGFFSNLWGLIVFLVGYAFVAAFLNQIEGITFNNLLSDNDLENRTTQLSVSDAVQWLCFAAASPLIGAVADEASMQMAFLAIASLSTSGFIALYAFKRVSLGS